MELKKRDIELLKHLRINSRKNITKISDETSISVSAIQESMKRLQKNVIKKHVSLIDFQKLGYGVHVHYLISYEKNNETKIKEYLGNSNSVNNLSELNGEHDLHAECFFSSMKDMLDFREELENLETISICEMPIVEEIKREAFIYNEDIL